MKRRSSGAIGGEDLGQQIVAERPVVAREVVDEALGLRMAPQRVRREPQCADPSFGVLPEPPHMGLPHCDLEAGEHVAGLVERERELGAADLGQLVLQPQPPEVQRRVGARGHDQPQRVRWVA
jgi:hypothetical protein